MSTHPSPQWIELEGAANVRDVGGLPTVDGRTTRAGVLLRSANLQSLTDADVRQIREDLRVAAVIDLRTDNERRIEGPGPLAGVVEHHGLTLLPQPAVEDVDADADVDAEAEAAMPTDRRRENQSDYQDMTGHYVGYVEDGGKNLATALRLIAGTPGPVLVHCAAGKDRTGTLVALALSLSGVTRDAVVADYVATNERIEAVHASLLGSKMYAHNLRDVTVDMIRPRADSMERFLDHVDRVYGGPHGLAMSLGVDEETVARLVARLVGSTR